MLQLHELTAGYGRNLVLRNITAAIPAGKVTVILGPNGCGKSTLLKSICGILPAKGRAMLDGEDLLSMPAQRRAEKTAYLAQGQQVPQITVGRLVLHGRFPYLSYPRQYRREDYKAARDAMEQMEILELAQLPLAQLSGGQRQKVYIAMALAQDAQIVLLDEPTTFLDAAHQLQLMDLAKALTDRGKTVVMVLHDLPLALQTADHILLMESGAIVASGAPETVFTTGEIDRVFGIRLRQIQMDGHWQYFVRGSRRAGE